MYSKDQQTLGLAALYGFIFVLRRTQRALFIRYAALSPTYVEQLHYMDSALPK